MIKKILKGKNMPKFQKVSVVSVPTPVYNNLISFLQELPYKTVAQLLQQIAGTMSEDVRKIRLPDPEPEPEDDPASGDEATD